jgi:hypothetical protein
MLVDRISKGSATFTFTDADLNALGLACFTAAGVLIDEEDAATSALIEAMGAAFVGAWHAVKAQFAMPVGMLESDNGGGDCEETKTA